MQYFSNSNLYKIIIKTLSTLIFHVEVATPNSNLGSIRSRTASSSTIGWRPRFRTVPTTRRSTMVNRPVEGDGVCWLMAYPIG